MSSRELAGGARQPSPDDPETDPTSPRAPRSGPGRLLFAGAAVGALLGALLLVLAEFTTLTKLKTALSRTPVRSIGTGSHHTYALIPVALLVAVLALGVWRVGSRPALLAIGVLGVLGLLIGLLGDLPDADRSGFIATAGHHYAEATAMPSAGLYLETLGAVVLVVTSVSGFLVLGAPVPPGRRPSDPPSSSPTSRAS